MRRIAYPALTFTAWAALVLIFLYLIVSAWTTSERIAAEMWRTGWGRYFRMTEYGAVRLLLRCSFDPYCRPAFNRAFDMLYPRKTVLMLPVLLLVGIVAYRKWKALEQEEEVKPGAARWALWDELKPMLRGTPTNPLRGYVGLLPIPAWKALLLFRRPPVLRLREQDRCTHCVVIGGPGARKTTGYHMPNIMFDALDGCSVVIIDMKFPDPESGFLGCLRIYTSPPNGSPRHDVQLFLPFMPNYSLRLPLLYGVTTKEDALDIVDMISPMPLRERYDQFFRYQERDLLHALILGVTRDGEPPSLGRVYRILEEGAQGVARYIARHPDEEVRRIPRAVLDMEDLLPNIIAGAKGYLKMFGDEALDITTTPSRYPWQNVDLEQIGEVPTLLYIGIPQEKVKGGAGRVLLRLLKRAIDTALLRTADRHGGKLPVHTNVYIDEFANMGELPDIAEMLNTMRSRRVAYHLSLQNRAQGEHVYGGQAGFRSFFNSVQNVIIFPRSLTYDDASYFSDVLGLMTVPQRSTGTTRRGVYTHYTEWERNVVRPLVPHEEFADEPRNAAYLYRAGHRPVRILMPRIDERRASFGVPNPLHTLFNNYLQTPRSEAEMADYLKELMFYHDLRFFQSRPWLRWELQEKVKIDETREQQPATVPSPTAPRVEEQAPQGPTPPTPEPPPRPPAEQTGARPPQQDMHTTPALSHEAMLSFRQWCRDVAAQSLPEDAVQLHYNEGRVTKISIRRDALPPHLSAPPDLLAWMNARWVRVDHREIGIIGAGIQNMPKKARRRILFGSGSHPSGSRPAAPPPAAPEQRAASPPARLRSGNGGAAGSNAERAAPAEAGGAADAAYGDGRDAAPPAAGSDSQTASQGTTATAEAAARALRILREWVDANGACIIGHPGYSPESEPKGIYQAGVCVILSVEMVVMALRVAGLKERDIQEIREYWRAAGWTKADQGRRTARRRIGGRLRRVVEFEWATWTGVPVPPS